MQDINSVARIGLRHYSKNLELVAKSAVNVLDATPVYPSAGGICVVDENNNICLLKFDTLEQIK